MLARRGPGKDCDEQVTLKVLGKNKAFTPGFDPFTVSRGDPITTIKKMLQMEMASEPKWVGGNVNIIQLDARGAQWITHYPECSGR